MSLTLTSVTCLRHHDINYKKMTDHLLTPARRGSIVDMQLYGPQGGSSKMKPLPLNETDRNNTTDTPSNFRSGTPLTPKDETIPAIHQPRTKHTFRLPDVVDADNHLHPLLNYLPSSAPTLEHTPSQWRSPRTQVHHKDIVAATISPLRFSNPSPTTETIASSGKNLNLLYSTSLSSPSKPRHQTIQKPKLLGP